MAAMLIVYDAECPVCRRARDWLARHDAYAQLDFAPCASAMQRDRAPQVSEQACREAMQVVLLDGRVYAGAEAVERLLPVLPPPWRWLKVCFKLPGCRRMAPFVYAFIARHRMAISGLLPGHGCGDNAACDIGKGDRDGRA